MSSPQHGLQLVKRVQNLETSVIAINTDVAEVKTALKRLPSTIRREVCDYVGPVLGDIMAGHGTLPTRLDLHEVEQRLTDKFEHRFSVVDSRLDTMDTRLDAMDTRLNGIDTRLDTMDSRLNGIDTRLDGIDTRLDRIDTRLDQILAALSRSLN